jgi:hypothetical protein
MQDIEQTVLGTDWYIRAYPMDGWEIKVTDTDTGDVLYHYRAIADSLWEAVCTAAYHVWEKELEREQDYEFQGRVAAALGIEEPVLDW